MTVQGVAAENAQVCRNCVYWRSDEMGDKVVAWGQCRRMPPAVPPIEDDKLVHVGVWPHTQESDWCGEWSAGDRREPPRALATGG